MARKRHLAEEEELVVTIAQQNRDRTYDLEAARERMRKKREDPAFRRRELAALKAMRRLAREQPTRFMHLLEEELSK